MTEWFCSTPLKRISTFSRASRFCMCHTQVLSYSTIFCTIYLYCSASQYNIFVLSQLTIQYVGIVKFTNTIYLYCYTHQYNILVTIYIAIYCSTIYCCTSLVQDMGFQVYTVQVEYLGHRENYLKTVKVLKDGSKLYIQE